VSAKAPQYQAHTDTKAVIQITTISTHDIVVMVAIGRYLLLHDQRDGCRMLHRAGCAGHCDGVSSRGRARV